MASRTEPESDHNCAESLKPSEQFQRLADSTVVGIVHVGMDGQIKEANDTFLRILRNSRQDLVSGRLRWDVIVIPECARLDELAGLGTCIPQETEMTRGDGSRVPVLLVVAAMAGTQDCLCFVIDLDERRRAEKELRRKTMFADLLRTAAIAANEAEGPEAALQIMLDRVCAAIEWPVGHVYIRASVPPFDLIPAAIWHTKTPKRFQTLRSITEMTPLSNAAGLIARIGATAQPEWIADVTADSSFVRARGREDIGVRAVFAVPVLVRDEVVAVLEFFSDRVMDPDTALLETMVQMGRQLGRVFERRQAEEALRQSREKHEELINSIDGIVWETDAQIRFTFVSKQAERLLGYPRENWLQDPSFWESHIYPEDRQVALASCRRAIAEKNDQRFEYRMIAAGGRVLWLKDIVSVVVENDKVEKLRGVMIDISSQKQAEAQLELLAQAIRSVNESISITDLDNNILFVNNAFLKTYGYDEADLVGKNIAIVRSSNNDPEVLREILSSTRRSGWQGELLNRKKDGTEFPVRLSTSIVRDQSGRPSALMGVATDISERRLLEDQLRQSQKMEAIGRLAGGIAHDFNNLLTAILGYSGLLLDSVSLDDPQRGKLQEIQKAGERAALLTQQLLAFSRKQVLAPQVLDLNKLVHETESMLRRIIGEDIEMTTIFDPTLCHIRADRSQVEQVILNLVVNARDAMTPGGQLVIETENVEVDESYTHSHAEVPAGNYAMLAVSDSGIGMDRQTQAHIFEPFFTTKEEGRGTGLGLSTVYGIVKQNGGHIFVYSELGHGSTFKVYFPRSPALLEAVVPARISDLAVKGSEIILLVEDESAVRELIQNVLTSNGYTVLDAASGEAGLNLSETYSGVIDLVVTDIVLPRMSGREMAERLKASRESIRVLYLSGYTEEAIFHSGNLDEGIAFLAKPFSSQVLLRKIRELLSA